MEKFMEIENETAFSDLDDSENENDELESTDENKFKEVDIPHHYTFRQFYNVYNYLSD